MAMFDGPQSPITQTFGLGLFDPVTTADLAQIEAFFEAHGAPSHHEVSPIAGPAIVGLLTDRRYQPFEFTSVMYRPTGDRNLATAPNPALHIRTVGEADGEVWARTAAEGWSETAGAGDFMLTIGRIFRGDGRHAPVPSGARRPADCGGHAPPARRRRVDGGRQHHPIGPRPRRAAGAARTAVAGRVRQRLRYRVDGRAPREHFAAKRRAPRVPDRLHASEMETDMNRRATTVVVVSMLGLAFAAAPTTVDAVFAKYRPDAGLRGRRGDRRQAGGEGLRHGRPRARRADRRTRSSRPARSPSSSPPRPCCCSRATASCRSTIRCASTSPSCRTDRLRGRRARAAHDPAHAEPHERPARLGQRRAASPAGRARRASTPTRTCSRSSAASRR